jgi:ribosomal protein L37AE/L43A
MNTKIYCVNCKGAKSSKVLTKGIWKCNTCGNLLYLTEAGLIETFVKIKREEE